MLLLGAAPAGAIVGGLADTSNSFANVGMLQGQFAPGQWGGFCSGTLVRQNVVLTAAHCVDFLQEVGDDGFGPSDLRLSFAPDGGSAYYYVDHIVTHPDWYASPPNGCRGNSKHCYLSPPHEDIALVFLSSNVAGVSPATVAGAGYLDSLDLTREPFTAVGYGVDGS